MMSVNKRVLKGTTLLAVMIGGVAVPKMARADDKVLLRCSRGDASLQIVETSPSTYEYLAERYAPRHCPSFTECERPVIYQSRGPVQAQQYAYALTGNFKSDDVNAMFVCGRLYSFIDTNPKQPTSMLFHKEECDFSGVGL